MTLFSNYNKIYNSEIARKNYSKLEELFNGLYQYYLKQIQELNYILLLQAGWMSRHLKSSSGGEKFAQ